MLQRSLDAGVEDYELLMEGNKSLLVASDTLRDHDADLEPELAEARARAAKDIAALEAKVRLMKNISLILKRNLSRTWLICACCMSVMFKASEVSAR
jgi:hypothetical protein